MAGTRVLEQDSIGNTWVIQAIKICVMRVMSSRKQRRQCVERVDANRSGGGGNSKATQGCTFFRRWKRGQ